MRNALLCVGFLLFALGCAQQEQNGFDGSSRSIIPTPEKLYGAWTTQQFDSSYPEWRNATGYQLFVYEAKKLDVVQSNLPGNLIEAELIVLKQDGTFELMNDTQPVFATEDKLYFGPIGSCYQFDYKLSDSKLKLDLHTRDGGWLKLHLARTSADPGKPRFPEVSGRWR